MSQFLAIAWRLQRPRARGPLVGEFCQGNKLTPFQLHLLLLRCVRIWKLCPSWKKKKSIFRWSRVTSSQRAGTCQGSQVSRVGAGWITASGTCGSAAQHRATRGGGNLAQVVWISRRNRESQISARILSRCKGAPICHCHGTEHAEELLSHLF